MRVSITWLFTSDSKSIKWKRNANWERNTSICKWANCFALTVCSYQYCSQTVKMNPYHSFSLVVIQIMDFLIINNILYVFIVKAIRCYAVSINVFPAWKSIDDKNSGSQLPNLGSIVEWGGAQETPTFTLLSKRGVSLKGGMKWEVTRLQNIISPGRLSQRSTVW